MRGETKTDAPIDLTELFQSTPLMRGETDEFFAFLGHVDISIHSPHARGDSRGTVMEFM